MPLFVTAVDLAAPVVEVFDFFRRPANRLRVAPPEWYLRLQDAADLLQLGARLTLVGRRWGLRHRSVLEVTAYEPPASFVEEQKEGAFRHWVHTHRFEATPAAGTRVTDAIDYEPPGGMLGLMLTPAAVERELNEFFRYRNEQLAEILARR